MQPSPPSRSRSSTAPRAASFLVAHASSRGWEDVLRGLVSRSSEAWALPGVVLVLAAGAIALSRHFDGLYGQDAYAYFDYATTSVRESLLHLQPLEAFFWPPGYPLLVALTSLVVGPRPLAGQLVSLLMGGLVPIFTALLARELFPRDRLLWLLSAALVAACGQLWQSSVVVMADTTGLALATFGAFALVRYTHGSSGGWLIAASAAVAYATLARWIYGLVGVPFALYVLWYLFSDGRHRSRRVPVAAIGVAALILAPIVGPPLVGLLEHPGQPAAFAGNFQVYSWSPLNALRHDFFTADGHLEYTQPNGLYYAAAPFNLAFFGPLLAPWIAVGLLGAASFNLRVFRPRPGPSSVVGAFDPAREDDPSTVAVDIAQPHPDEAQSRPDAVRVDIARPRPEDAVAHHHAQPDPDAVAADSARPDADAVTADSAHLRAAATASRRWSRSSALLVVGWAACVYAFHAGAPWQNFRFTLAYLPPVGMLAAAGLLLAWRDARRWLRLLAAACAVAGLVLTLAGAVRLVERFIDTKDNELALVRWVQSETRPEAQLLTFGPTLAFRHYSNLPTFDLYDLSASDISDVLRRSGPDYLLVDVASVEDQWLNQAPSQNYHLLRDGPGLTELGSLQGYTLYQIIPLAGP